MRSRAAARVTVFSTKSAMGVPPHGATLRVVRTGTCCGDNSTFFGLAVSREAERQAMSSSSLEQKAGERSQFRCILCW